MPKFLKRKADPTKDMPNSTDILKNIRQQIQIEKEQEKLRHQKESKLDVNSKGEC
jgi:hypothetical protein